ncbi:MAG: ribonuclease HII [Rhabdochlamydiaceae bacterium]|jgi:ribonuclease HII
MSQLLDLSFYEQKAKAAGYRFIAGVDEAGRGPLAGPVVAAACYIPSGICFEGIDDSKKLSPGERSKLYQQITQTPGLVYGIGIVESFIINQINILQATFLAMQLAIAHMPLQPDYLLIDGNRLPLLTIPALPITRGDSLSHSIMAAAILAKCTRDQIMLKAHRLWPFYGFDQHKGYGTPQHLQALQEKGPCVIHRNFAPIKSFLLTHFPNCPRSEE